VSLYYNQTAPLLNLLSFEASTKDLTLNTFACISVHSKRLPKSGFEGSKVHPVKEKMGPQNQVLKWLSWAACIADI